jgi:hypothetical protein
MFMQIAIGAIGIGVVSASGDINSALGSTQATVFAGFGLVAVGIIVLAAFGLINIFK